MGNRDCRKELKFLFQLIRLKSLHIFCQRRHFRTMPTFPKGGKFVMKEKKAITTHTERIKTLSSELQFDGWTFPKLDFCRSCLLFRRYFYYAESRHLFENAFLCSFEVMWHSMNRKFGKESTCWFSSLLFVTIEKFLLWLGEFNAT